MHTGSSVYCKHTNTHTLAQREAVMSYVTSLKWVPQGQRETSSLKKTLFVSGFG